MSTKQAAPENPTLAEYAGGYKPDLHIDPKSPEARPYHQQYGKELINSALWGLGLGAGGTALYHLINGANSSRLSELRGLLNNPAPASENKARPAKSKKKKPAPAAGTSWQMPEFKFAGEKSAAGLLGKFQESISKNLVPTQFVPEAMWPTAKPDAAPSLNTAHHGWRQAANIIAAMGGGYGGMQLVNSLAADKRKKDIDDEVDTARKAYFAALTGKEAQALDAVFTAVKTAENTVGGGDVGGWLAYLGLRSNDQPSAVQNFTTSGARAVQDAGHLAWTSALLTGLGTGAIGAKYMYDQTKARTRAENLMRARNSKARLQMLNQTPYVDPDELAALTGR
jgi:hypothetical protein